MGVSPIAIYVYMMVRAGRTSRSEERAGLVKLGAVSLIVRIISHEIYLEIVYTKCYYSINK